MAETITVTHLRHRNIYNKVEDLFIIRGIDARTQPDLTRRGWRRKPEHNGLVTKRPVEALMVAATLRADWVYEDTSQYDRLNAGSDLALRDGNTKRSRPRLK